MSLILASLLLLGIWFFIQHVVLKSLRNRLEQKFTGQSMARFGVLAAVAFIGRFAKIAGITYLLVWAFLKVVYGLSFVFDDPDGMVSKVVSLIPDFNGYVESINADKVWLILPVFAFVFILLISRKAKATALEIYHSLKKDANSGKLPFLQPTAQMEKLKVQTSNARENLKMLQSPFPSELSAEELKKRDLHIELLKQAIPAMDAQLVEMDVKRRLVPELEKRTNSTEKADGNKVLNFLVSKGLIRSLHHSSRALGIVGIGLMLISFLVGNKSVLVNETTQLSHKIYDLRVDAERKELDDEWQEALAQFAPIQSSEEDIEWTEEDERKLNAISRQFELSIAQSFRAELKEAPSSVIFHLRADAVRSRVFQSYVQSRKTTTRSEYEVLESGARLSSEEAEDQNAKAYAKFYADNVESNEPRTYVGTLVRERIRQYAQSRKDFWAKITEQYDDFSGSFKKSATPNEVLGLMFGESFGELVRMADGGASSSELDQVTKELSQKVGTRVARVWLDAKVDRFLTGVVNESFEDAINTASSNRSITERLATSSARGVDFPTGQNVSNTLSPYRPGLTHNLIDAASARRSEQAVQALSNGSNQPAASFVDAITDFRYHFPPQLGVEMESPAGNLLHSPLSSSHVADASRVGPDMLRTASRTVASRARSFVSLRGFRKIGGVLIGQIPTNAEGSNLDFRDISWKETNGRIEVFLHRSDGEIISAGVYERDMVNQALQYAADGRPITVTMVNANPIPFLKILLHPTLVNTDLGCKAVGLDRLVDKYAGSESEEIQNALSSFQYQNLLYQYASFRAFANQSSSNESYVSEYLDNYENVISSKWYDIYDVLDRGDVFNDRYRSHIAAKPQYYHSAIVRALSDGLESSGGYKSKFLDALKGIDLRDSLGAFLKVETEQWSGVRELPYALDESLSFLKPTSSDNKSLYPLTFMRQVAYTPTYPDADFQDTEDPWEFPQLSKSGIIEELVLQGALSNNGDWEVLERMRDFTTLQRVFRCALNGYLGMEFPVEKLVELADDTSPYVRNRETPTWNSSGATWSEFLLYYGDEFEDEEQLKQFKTLWESQEISALKNIYPCN